MPRSLPHILLASLATLLSGCASSTRKIDFSPSHPLAGKRIGIFHDRRIIGTFEGLDGRDSEEYLNALGASLARLSGNATFRDLTPSGVRVTAYQPHVLKKPEGLRDSIAVEYRVPAPGSLGAYGDSLDYVLVFQNLSVRREVAVDYVEEKAFPALQHSYAHDSHTRFLQGLTRLRVVETDSQTVERLGYVLWDVKEGKALASEGKSLGKQKFMDRNTTFAEDAEVTGRRILQELGRARPLSSRP